MRGNYHNIEDLGIWWDNRVQLVTSELKTFPGRFKAIKGGIKVGRLAVYYKGRRATTLKKLCQSVEARVNKA